MTISSQHHSFDIALAAKYGPECAILIHHFQHWIRINRFAKRNIKEGRCWTYQKRKDIQAHMPYWTVDEIRRLTDKLVDHGVLMKGNFNKSPIDNTIWYAFVDEAAFGLDEKSSKNVYERQNCQSTGKSATPTGKIAKAIPDTKTDTITEDKEKRGGKPPNPPTPLPIFSNKRVKMEQAKYDALVKDFGVAKINQMVDRLDEYADINRKRFNQYSCHAAVIRKWIRDDAEKKSISNSTPSKHIGITKDRSPVSPGRVINADTYKTLFLKSEDKKHGMG